MNAAISQDLSEFTITLILSCSLLVTDRYQLAREFEIQKFEMTVMKCDDLYSLQELCVKLFAQTVMQRRVYEDMLRDVGRLPPAQ